MKGGRLSNTDWISLHFFFFFLSPKRSIFFGIRHICQITQKGIPFPGKVDVLVVKEWLLIRVFHIILRDLSH